MIHFSYFNSFILEQIFTKQGAQNMLNRIEKLSPDTQPQWGKMNVAQMLAHLSVAYEGVYDNKHAKPGAFARFMLKLFVKNTVVGSAPYKRNSRTAPQFLITDERVYASEKARLVEFINKTQALGAAHFDGKESHSFGPLSVEQWNTLFAKHLDHHLTQFGV